MHCAKYFHLVVKGGGWRGYIPPLIWGFRKENRKRTITISLLRFKNLSTALLYHVLKSTYFFWPSQKTWILKNHLGVIWIYWHGCSKLYDSDDHKYGAAAHGLKTSFCLIGISRPLEPTEARTSFLHGLYTNFLKGSSKVTNTYSVVASLRFPARSSPAARRRAVFLWIEKGSERKSLVTNNRIAIWRVFSLHESCNECNT